MSGSRNNQIFISYARSDAGMATLLEQMLISEGFRVWRDVHRLDGGMTWKLEIVRAIDKSAAVVVLWSADALGSRYVHDEADLGVKKLVPIQLDHTPLPLGFKTIQSIKLERSGESLAASKPRILKSICHVCAKSKDWQPFDWRGILLQNGPNIPHERAISILERAIEDDPSDFEAIIEMITRLMRSGNYRKAAEVHGKLPTDVQTSPRGRDLSRQIALRNNI
jgi:hypothetical protein